MTHEYPFDRVMVRTSTRFDFQGKEYVAAEGPGVFMGSPLLSIPPTKVHLRAALTVAEMLCGPVRFIGKPPLKNDKRGFDLEFAALEGGKP